MPAPPPPKSGAKDSQSWLLWLMEPAGFRGDSSGPWLELVKGVVGEGEHRVLLLPGSFWNGVRL